MDTQRPTATGFQLLQERKRRDWKQEDLAERAHIDRPQISRLENRAQIPHHYIALFDSVFGGTAWRQGPEIYTAVGKSVSIPDRVRDGPPSPPDYGAVMAEMDKRWKECVESIKTQGEELSRLRKEVRDLRLFRGTRKRRAVGKKEGRR